MRKEKFYFNTQTLQYEKVITPMKTKILRGIGLLCGVFVAALVLVSITYHFFPTPKEEALLREMDQMKRHYAEMGIEVERMTKVLNNLQERDVSVHRMVFGMDPIDENQWEVGIGGNEKYSFLTNFKNSGEILRATQERVDKNHRRAGHPNNDVQIARAQSGSKNPAWSGKESRALRGRQSGLGASSEHSDHRYPASRLSISREPFEARDS